MTVVRGADRAGDVLREWRNRRGVSQLELASRSAVSARHLSFIETGRTRPSREMLLHLADRLELPLRERNRLLLAGGFAPVFGERPLDDPQMEPIRLAVERLLAAHEPYPAAVHDPRWYLVAANRGAEVFLENIAPRLLEPPVNMMRATLHPDGLAPRIANFAEWSGHTMSRLRRELSITGDPELAAMLDEFRSYPGVRDDDPTLRSDASAEIVVPLRLHDRDRELAFFSTVTSFGSPLDATVADLTIEAFYPADTATATCLRELIA